MRTSWSRWLLISILPVAAGALLAGCSFDPSGVSPGSDGGPGGDAALPGEPDASTADAPPGCQPGCAGDSVRVCEPEEALMPCALGCNAEAGACFERLVPSNGAGIAHPDEVSAALVVPAGTAGSINTDTGEIDVNGQRVRQPLANDIDSGIGFYLIDGDRAVLSLTGLTVKTGATLRAAGTRALIVLSTGDVVIEGVVDVSAACVDGVEMRCGGPGGGNGATVSSQTSQGCAPGGNGTGGGGGPDETGGGGGGLGTDGAPGGDGGNRLGGLGGTIAGTACPGPELVPLRGGSAGGAGGIDSSGGDGGGGGGGLQITSLTRIAITGQHGDAPSGILAAGGGGGGSEDVIGGGGGGGAGGAILLEAPAIELSGAVLAANGGGGGGGDDEDGNRGENGAFGDRQALGGGSGSNQGGLGAAGQNPATAGAGGGDNTGGGGGGAGIIRLNVPAAGLTITDSVISPPHAHGNLPAQ